MKISTKKARENMMEGRLGMRSEKSTPPLVFFSHQSWHARKRLVMVITDNNSFQDCMFSPGQSHYMNYWYKEAQTIYYIKMVNWPSLEWLIVVLYELVNIFTPGPYSTISTSLSGTFHFSLYFAFGSITICMARSFFLKTTTAQTHSYNNILMLIKTCHIFIYNIAG